MGKMDPIQPQTYHSAIPNLPRVLIVLKHFREEEKKKESCFFVFLFFFWRGGVVFFCGGGVT